MKSIFHLGLLVSFLIASTAGAEVQIGSICRVKGQEKRVVIGYGIVVGLSGTGDPNQAETQRSLASIFGKLNNAPVDMRLFKNAKNVAIVFVRAEIPACGARQGDQINCTVASVGGAKSLKGGSLFSTAMLPEGPGIDPNQPMPVCGYASGMLELDSGGPETVARITKGFRVEQEFINEFVKDGKVTLVLDRDHASFGVSNAIVEAIKKGKNVTEVEAIGQNNIVITIPKQIYGKDPTKFVASILQLPITSIDTPACVVINRRTGVIVLTGDVEIGPVAISSGNFDVAVATGGADVEQFLALDQSANGPGVKPNAKLRSLLAALKQIKASPQTQADIIIQIDRAQKLYARLIVE